MARFSKTEKPRYCNVCKDRLELNQGKAGYCKSCKSEYDKDRKARMLREYHTYLSNKGCVSCGERHHYTLEVHHLSKDYKRYGRAQAAQHNVEDIEDGKAVVLCGNCHNLFHGYFGGKVKPFPTQTIESTKAIIELARGVVL